MLRSEICQTEDRTHQVTGMGKGPGRRMITRSRSSFRDICPNPLEHRNRGNKNTPWFLEILHDPRPRTALPSLRLAPKRLPRLVTCYGVFICPRTLGDPALRSGGYHKFEPNLSAVRTIPRTTTSLWRSPLRINGDRSRIDSSGRHNAQSD